MRSARPAGLARGARHGRAADRRAGRWGAGATGRRALGMREAAGAGASSAGLAGRQARCLGAGRAAWACELALGCALGAIGLFLARFDSVFF